MNESRRINNRKNNDIFPWNACNHPLYELSNPLYIVDESYFRYNSIKGKQSLDLSIASSSLIRAEIFAVISDRSRIFRSSVMLTMFLRAHSGLGSIPGSRPRYSRRQAFQTRILARWDLGSIFSPLLPCFEPGLPCRRRARFRPYTIVPLDRSSCGAIFL